MYRGHGLVVSGLMDGGLHLGRHAVVDSVRVRPEAVGVGFSFFAVPYEEYDGSHQRDKADKIPTPPFAYVVEAAPCYGEPGNEHAQGYEPAYDGNPSQGQSYDECEQCEPPVFRTGSAAVEVGIFRETNLDSFNKTYSAEIRVGIVWVRLPLAVLVLVLWLRVLPVLALLGLLLLPLALGILVVHFF